MLTRPLILAASLAGAALLGACSQPQRMAQAVNPDAPCVLTPTEKATMEDLATRGYSRYERLDGLYCEDGRPAQEAMH